MSDKPQSFENHARFVSYFHGFVLPVLLINLIWTAYRVFAAPSVATVVALLLALALIALALAARVFALKVQDRIIRLEMRLRLRELLPPDLHPRIPELTIRLTRGAPLRERCRAPGPHDARPHRPHRRPEDHQADGAAVAGRSPACVTCAG